MRHSGLQPGGRQLWLTQSVTITTTTGGATIRYTTNGTVPSSTVGTVYSSAVSITATATLQAIAYETGYAASAVASGVYTIDGACATPTFNPLAGTYGPAVSVTISSATNGATIRYTTDGSTPSTTAGTIYCIPVSISTVTTTLQAIAYESGYANSAVASGIYTFEQCATPTFTPAPGNYDSAQSVTIGTTTGGATIMYTTDGTPPSETVGTVYSSPVTINTTGMLQAIAYKSGLADSTVASGNYTIGITVLTTQTPTTPTAATYELGMQFESAVAGQITAIRYYEETGETGTHVGHIWSSAGVQLASVTFTGETGSGWQTEALTTPLPIAANTVYVVSVNCNSECCYSAYAMEEAIVNGPLSSLPAADGGNAVWNTTLGAFPNDSNDVDCNYFRDIVFCPTMCATPTFSPAAGVYYSAQSVTIASTTNGATIRYTTDGSTPSETAGTVYSGALNLQRQYHAEGYRLYVRPG